MWKEKKPKPIPNIWITNIPQIFPQPLDKMRCGEAVKGHF
jgi:hypothetical protein